MRFGIFLPLYHALNENPDFGVDNQESFAAATTEAVGAANRMAGTRRN